MYKCPQCKATFLKEKQIMDHLKVDNRGEKIINGKLVKDHVVCPSWPQFQADYYLEKGLLELE